MSDDRTKADKAWEARQEAARYRIFNAATNAAEATDEADDENYFAVLDQAGNAAEAAAAEITGYKTYADLLEALDTRLARLYGCGEKSEAHLGSGSKFKNNGNMDRSRIRSFSFMFARHLLPAFSALPQTNNQKLSDRYSIHHAAL
jgi:hypothetical protein